MKAKRCNPYLDSVDELLERERRGYTDGAGDVLRLVLLIVFVAFAGYMSALLL